MDLERLSNCDKNPSDESQTIEDAQHVITLALQDIHTHRLVKDDGSGHEAIFNPPYEDARDRLKYALGPELTKWPFTTHKRTYQERYAAFWKASAWVRSGLNPSMFSDRRCSTPQT